MNTVASARPLLGTVGLAAAAQLAGTACAANFDVSVTDASAPPLADTVVFLQPTGSKLPLKPLARAEIAQAKRQFAPRATIVTIVTIVTVGTPVTLPYFDTVRRHVFWFSPTKAFELKLYAGVPGAPVVFDKPGFAVPGSNIPDPTAAWMVVLNTPFHGLTAVSGKAHIDDVPAGGYRLRARHPGLAADAEALSLSLSPSLALTIRGVDSAQALRLNIANNPLASEP